MEKHFYMQKIFYIEIKFLYGKNISIWKKYFYMEKIFLYKNKRSESYKWILKFIPVPRTALV